MNRMSTELELSIVLVNHNSDGLLSAAVAAVQERTVCDEAEIIVVDAASTDGSAERVPGGHLPVELIRCSENVGFCRGNNLGVAAARGRLVCFVQPDGEVEAGWDVMLRAALEDPGVVVAGGVVLKIGGQRIDSAGLAIAPNLAAWSLDENRTVEQAGLRSGEPREVVGVSPAFLMTRRADHVAIGGFWEMLWMYGDEPDYALRIGRRGRVLVCPASFMRHTIGAAAGGHQSPLRLQQSSRNRLLNIARHLPAPRALAAIVLAAAFDAIQLVQQRNVEASSAVLHGWWKGLGGMRAARRLSTPAERAGNVPQLASLREALAQQRSLGRASIRKPRG
jgi:N-acetylglucosaminyl-diphospho-decaprenol L-rhamnosyltransferase